LRKVRYNKKIYTEETSEEYLKRCNEITDRQTEVNYTPFEELSCEDGIKSSIIAEKAAKSIIKRYKNKQTGFSCTKEAIKVKISPITLRKYIIKHLPSTHELVSLPGRSVILKKD